MRIGPCTHSVVAAILEQNKVRQQGYRACMGVLKLADKYSDIRLESACRRALSFTPTPSYKTVLTILKSDQDLLTTGGQNQQQTPEDLHAFTRGAKHYGGSYHE